MHARIPGEKHLTDISQTSHRHLREKHLTDISERERLSGVSVESGTGAGDGLDGCIYMGGGETLWIMPGPDSPGGNRAGHSRERERLIIVREALGHTALG